MDITRRYYERLHQENQAMAEANPDGYDLGVTEFDQDHRDDAWEFGLAIIKRGGIIHGYDETAGVLSWLAPKEEGA